MRAHDDYRAGQRRNRRGQRGVAALEVMLSLPVIILAFGGAMFVNQQMTQWAQAERGLADVVRLCSRRIEPAHPDERPGYDAVLIACVQQRLATTMLKDICPPADQAISVEREFDRPYSEDLATTVTIELPILKATLKCTPIIRVPLLEVEAATFEITSAMPIRIPTDMQP
ncbi:MAG: hypothetical protein VX589_07100 [Myxococcota bacterium]|nr:hypothetical protein [Myxococcota bacterium]